MVTTSGPDRTVGGAAATVRTITRSGSPRPERNSTTGRTTCRTALNVLGRPQTRQWILTIPFLTLAAFTLFGAGMRVALRVQPTVTPSAAPGSSSFSEAAAAGATPESPYDIAYRAATRRDVGALCDKLDRLDDESQQQRIKTVVLSEYEVMRLRQTADLVRDRMDAQPK